MWGEVDGVRRGGGWGEIVSPELMDSGFFLSNERVFRFRSRGPHAHLLIPRSASLCNAQARKTDRAGAIDVAAAEDSDDDIPDAIAVFEQAERSGQSSISEMLKNDEFQKLMDEVHKVHSNLSPLYLTVQ